MKKISATVIMLFVLLLCPPTAFAQERLRLTDVEASIAKINQLLRLPVIASIDQKGRIPFVLCVLLILIVFSTSWWKWGRDLRRGAVAPLSSPPENLEAGYAGYVKKLKFDTNLLLSDLIQLAMQGQIALNPHAKYLEVEKVAPEWGDDVSPAHRQLLLSLLPGEERSIRLAGKAKEGVLSAPMIAARMSAFYGMELCEKPLRPDLMKWNHGPVALGWLLFLPLIATLCVMESPLAMDAGKFGVAGSAMFWIFVVILPLIVLLFVCCFCSAVLDAFRPLSTVNKIIFGFFVLPLVGLILNTLLTLPQGELYELMKMVGVLLGRIKDYCVQNSSFVVGIFLSFYVISSFLLWMFERLEEGNPLPYKVENAVAHPDDVKKSTRIEEQKNSQPLWFRCFLLRSTMDKIICYAFAFLFLGFMLVSLPTLPLEKINEFVQFGIALLEMIKSYYIRDPLLVGGVWAAFLVASFFSPLMSARTKEGRPLLDQVEGIERYLKTAGKRRSDKLYPKYNDASSELTVAFYERFLPYALALDVMGIWTKICAPILKKNNYHPLWLRGYCGVESFSQFLSAIKRVIKPPPRRRRGLFR